MKSHFLKKKYNYQKSKPKTKKKLTRKIQKGGAVYFDTHLNMRLQFFNDPDKSAKPVDELINEIKEKTQLLNRQVYSSIELETVVDEPQTESKPSYKISLDGQRNLLFKYSRLLGSEQVGNEIQQTFKQNFREFNDFVNKNSPEGRNTFTYPQYAKYSELTLGYMHGGITMYQDKMFSVVPANTLICFTTPLDYLYTISMQDRFNIGLNFSEMSTDLYIEIFRKHMKLRDMGFGDFETQPYYLPWYNCLVDSMWYYPGQVYPNLEFSATHDDYEVNGKTMGIRFLNISSGKPAKVIHMEDDVYYNPAKMNPLLKAEDSMVSYMLNDLVDYNPRNKKFRVIIAICCRPIFIEDMDDKVKQQIIYHELLFYHINYEMIKSIPFTLRGDLFVSKCYSQSTKKYYLHHTKLFENNQFIDSPTFKNINFDSRVPSLQKIKDTINNSPPGHINITLSELTYIRSMSFKKLFLFISMFNPETVKLLVRKLVQHFYTDININVKQYIFGLRHHTYYHNQIPIFDHQHEVIKYMHQLADLFLKESGLFNLFIEENISRFLHDVNSQKMQNTIFNSPVEGEKTYEHILFDGVIYGDIEDQIDFLGGDLQNLRSISLLDSPETSPRKPYSGVEKLILGKGFSGFASSFSGKGRDVTLLSTVFTKFPNIRELVFRDCFNSGEKMSRNTFSLGSVRAIHLTSLILRDTKINLDFNQFENLEYLEIENNPAIRFLNLENKKIKNVVLCNLKTLSLLNVKKLKLELLKLVNINENVAVSLGEVEKLVIEESFPKKIATSKKIFDLELSDVRLNFEDLKKIIPVSGGFSLSRKKSRSASLNFVNIFINGTEFSIDEQMKKDLLSSLKGLRYVDLNFLNFQDNTNQGQPQIRPIKFSNTDLLVLDKKTQVTICRENFKGDRTERKRDITIR